MSDDVNQINQDLETIEIVNRTSEAHRQFVSQIDMTSDSPSPRVTESAFDGAVTVIAIVVGLAIVVGAILLMMS